MPDTTCYLWRNFATTGARANEYEIYLPFATGRYAVYSFQDYISTSGGCRYFGRFKEGVPVVNKPSTDASVTKVGVWTSPANAPAYNGITPYSTTAGDTITATVTGHTLILRVYCSTNGGFGTVAIDGDFTAANLLPAVTQADVDAGHFSSGDIGKRYINCYGGPFEDEHFPLVEGLSDTAHTIQVRAQGTKLAASSAARCYVSGFAAATAGTKVTDTNASMGYVREVSNIRVANSFSKMTMVPEYTPSGFVNYQFMGGNHGNETFVSQGFKVDGVDATPASGAYVSGTTIESTLNSNLIHPSTGATVIAAKTTHYTGQAGEMKCEFNLTWQNAGTARNSYYGMMHVGIRPRSTSTLQNTFADRFLVGNNYVMDLSRNDESALGLSPVDLIAAFSTGHDTVAIISLPRLDLNVDSFSRAGTGAFVQDRADLTEKVYFSRSSALQTEAISVSAVHSGEIRWRMLRVPGAAGVVGF